MKNTVLIILVLGVFFLMACDEDAALDYSGTWEGKLIEGVDVPTSQDFPVRATIDPPDPILTPVVITLTQNGSALSGSGFIDTGDGIIPGTFSAGSVTVGEFTLALTFSNDGLITIIGTFSGETSATGTYTADGEIGRITGSSGTFTITKQ